MDEFFYLEFSNKGDYIYIYICLLIQVSVFENMFQQGPEVIQGHMLPVGSQTAVKLAHKRASHF